MLSKKHLDIHARMIERGDLIDMQREPFRQFNRIVENDCQIHMTRAAFRASVQLPGEKWRRTKIPSNGRWGIVYLSFLTEFQDRPDDPHEGTFDVNVLMPNGFQVPTTVKVVLDHNFQGEDAFVFMLPEEQWPPS